MSRMIVVSRYLKSGSQRARTKRGNYTKYIATRESVEKRDSNDPAAIRKSTGDQKKLISELLKEFPYSKNSLEYEDYKEKPTVANASELISSIVEKYADVIGNRKNFVGYMAKRPGAEQRGAHGLFNGNDEPIDLNKVAKEVSEHPGYVWSHVVSLRREDAVRLGYDNSDAWRNMIMKHINDIAKASKIPLANLKWYAAYHDTTHHPHIHLIVYSTDPRQGYLTQPGIEKIKSAFANDIFADELKSIYSFWDLIAQEAYLPSTEEMQNNTISKFIENDSWKRVWLFACNEANKALIELYSEKLNIVGVLDNSEAMWGKDFCGVKVCSVKETIPSLSKEKDVVIISLRLNADIAYRQITDMGFFNVYSLLNTVIPTMSCGYA